MGYTHYWSQRRTIGKAAWSQICEDIAQIIKFSQHEQGVALAGFSGDLGTSPLIDDDCLGFNGVGDDAHETFVIDRVKDPEDWPFCKTAHKPYDIAVTACLCYLSTIAETHSVSSDGNGRDWLAGLELARQALPRYSNQLDIPRVILEDDRWCAPWMDIRSKGYEFNFCVDGHAYITSKDGRSYRFDTHAEAAEFAKGWQEKRIKVHSWNGPRMEGGPGTSIFGASGAFDERRDKSLARQQSQALKWKLDNAVRTEPHKLIQPPALMRPGEMPQMDKPLPYTLDGVLEMAKAA